ncbi:hypothetical protein [Absidia glauca]|uniref:Ndc10 domain-containing protein n=1 Tax=Absidia glauca TaxID=4829 RepID=A0A168PD58_ABSGL|nr:hypothetical protein [Absidia glauca]
MASFPINGRSFYLARAALDPPTSLCKKLFTAIDEWHDRLAEKELSLNDNNPIQPTIAANAFVLMMEPHPCEHILQQSTFSDPAYLSFKGICSKLKLRNTILPTHSSGTRSCSHTPPTLCANAL